MNYLNEHEDKLKQMPFGAFAVVNQDDLIDDEIKPGVIFCLRGENTKIKIDNTYALAPFFLVYVDDSGDVLLNFQCTKKILDYFKKMSVGRSQIDDDALNYFNSLTRNASDMSHYQTLLAKAVTAITGKAEEKGVESLFQRGGTTLTKDSFQGIDDFEVVSYLIIKQKESKG